MPVTQEQVEAAYNRREAAQMQIVQAEAAIAALGNQAVPGNPAFETARSKVEAAKGEYSRANQDLNRISAQFNKENPNKPTTEAELKARAERLQRQKNKADPSFGMEVTDKERYDIEQRAKPKPPRTDSPAQIQTANTGAANAAETVRSNQAKESQDAVDSQRQALQQHGALYNTIRGQVSAEAQTRTTQGIQGIQEIRGAATTLVNTATTQREQDIKLQNERSAFVRDTLTSVMPQVVQLMLKTPKGSKVAANFLKAFIVMANEAYVKAGLDKNPPPLDINTPGFRTLMEIQGYEKPEQIPTMPSSNQISAEAQQAAAAGGFPVAGWQGPIGVGATAMPSPTIDRRNGQGVDPLIEAAQSPEGAAIRTKYVGPVAPIQEKKKRGETLTPQEQSMLDAAQAAYERDIKELAAKRQREKTTVAPGTPGAKQQELRQEVRSTLISGDPNQRLNLMTLAVVADQNKAAGKPLSPAETAVLANISPEDLELIKENMTPDVVAIVEKHKNKQPLTQDEIKRVETSVLATSEKIKSRPTPPAPTASTPPVAPPTQAETRPPMETTVAVTIPDAEDRVMIATPGGQPMSVPRHMVGEGPGQYSSRSGYRIVEDPKKTQTPKLMGPPLPVSPEDAANQAAVSERKRATAAGVPEDALIQFMTPPQEIETPALPTDWKERIKNMPIPALAGPRGSSDDSYVQFETPDYTPPTAGRTNIDTAGMFSGANDERPIPLLDPYMFRQRDEEEDDWWL